MKTPLSGSVIYAALMLLPLTFSTAQATPTPLWLDIPDASLPAKPYLDGDTSLAARMKKTATLRRTLQFDENQLQSHIHTMDAQQPLRIEVPLPDGSNTDIELHPVNTLSAELQQRYPQIKTWRISSTDPRILSGRAELTALGFRLMIRSTSGEQWLIEPMSQTTGESATDTSRQTNQTTPATQNRKPVQTANGYYQSYQKRQSSQTQSFSCGVQAGTETISWSWSPMHRQNTLSQWRPAREDTQNNRANRDGNKLLNYDLAISATGEYTQKFGGSKSAAYGAIVSTVSRINEIYKQELGIRFSLVSGEETIFSDPASDPFDNNGLLANAAQNQEVLDILVGSNRYDIGHVMGAAFSNNGVAYVASICNNGRKAQGITVSNAPLEDHFMVDYVAHEIGHQLGATHTFNSTQHGCGGGGRIASTAFEPGSGSTVMSYAGICASHNLQQHVDPQFHSGSVDQIHGVLTDRLRTSCAQEFTINNNVPMVNAGTDRVIPARTPFILNGSATDSDGDKLLYSWDQMDIGDASAPDTDTANNPLIKSNPLSSSGLRYVPDIAALLNKSESSIRGESLPRSKRQINFRLSVRDGKGAMSSDDLKLSVHDTGQDFRILSPTTTLSPGSHEVRWQVANTDQPPINCATVDIAYTNDKGKTFTDIALKTANDGNTTIELSQQAQHIRVKCSDNIFFALSGLTPQIAAYRNDTAQPTLTSPGGDTTSATAPDNTITTLATSGNDDGGGGTLPLYLLIWGMLVVLMKKGHRHKSDGGRKAKTT